MSEPCRVYWTPTPEQVEAATVVYDGPEATCPHADPSWFTPECDRCFMARILTAVGPSIRAQAKAEALTEAAQTHQGEAMSDYRDGYNQGWTDAIQFIRAGGVVPEGLCVPSCEHPHGTCLCNVREGK